MADLGNFCRVFLKGGYHLDFPSEHYQEVKIALTLWARYGEDESLELTDKEGCLITICASGINWVFVSTPKTRQASFDRQKLFDAEEKMRQEKSGFSQ